MQTLKLRLVLRRPLRTADDYPSQPVTSTINVHWTAELDVLSILMR